MTLYSQGRKRKGYEQTNGSGAHIDSADKGKGSKRVEVSSRMRIACGGIRSFETDRGRALRSACFRAFRRSALLQQAFGAVRFVSGDVVCVGDRLRIGFRRSVRRHAGCELCPHQMPPQNQQMAADTLSCRVSDFFRAIQNLRESGAGKQADCRRRGNCIFLRMYLRAARAFYQGTEISSYR